MKKTENAFTSKEPLTNMYKYQVKSQSGKRGGEARAKALGGNTFNMSLSKKQKKPIKVHDDHASY